MICENCKETIAESSAVCPYCGTTTNIYQEKPAVQSPTSYGKFPMEQFGQMETSHSYGQGYTPQPFPPSPQQHYSARPAYGPAPIYRQQPMYGPMGPMISTKNNNALITEIILSLFGIFGVGWIMAGETTTETTIGVILLVCSIFIYWPIAFLSAITIIGLACLVPFATAAIIINILLLNSKLNRKAAQFIPMQPGRMPPQ